MPFNRWYYLEICCMGLFKYLHSPDLRDLGHFGVAGWSVCTVCIHIKGRLFIYSKRDLLPRWKIWVQINEKPTQNRIKVINFMFRVNKTNISEFAVRAAQVGRTGSPFQENAHFHGPPLLVKCKQEDIHLKFHTLYMSQNVYWI